MLTDTIILVSLATTVASPQAPNIFYTSNPLQISEPENISQQFSTFDLSLLKVGIDL